MRPGLKLQGISAYKSPSNVTSQQSHSHKDAPHQNPSAVSQSSSRPPSHRKQGSSSRSIQSNNVDSSPREGDNENDAKYKSCSHTVARNRENDSFKASDSKMCHEDLRVYNALVQTESIGSGNSKRKESAYHSNADRVGHYPFTPAPGGGSSVTSRKMGLRTLSR